MARMSMLIDLTRCIGCDACTVACKQENGTPVDVFFARVINIEAGTYPAVRRVYLPVLCNHCENPACLKACPNKAIYKRDDGIVLIDQDRCRGTGACVSACPYGNIILSQTDKWYLQGQPYERDFVQPRLKPQVARKCTLCAHRVDEGLKPACVVACPTTARIFGDTDDPTSEISSYVRDQKRLTGRDPFKLMPEAKTEPATMYMGTMADQDVAVGQGNRTADHQPARAEASSAPAAPAPANVSRFSTLWRRVGKTLGLFGLVMAMQFAASQAISQQNQEKLTPAETFANSSCMGCHGPTAMGGLGPPLAETKKTFPEFEALVRTGKGMMPGAPPSEVSREEIESLYTYVTHTKLDPTQIPISYKIGALMSIRNVAILFAVVSLIATILALKVIAYWVQCAGWKQLKPAVAKYGYGRALGVFLQSLVVDGLFVSSLWKKDKFRWAMHGLLLYGFLGLGLADILLSIFNPLRSELPYTSPLKMLPNVSGLAVLIGIVYVRYRYRKDEYIDNGMTIGRDYLFINLLALTILSGFLVEVLKKGGAFQFVQPLYIFHLGVVATLLLSAPFTRFAHVFVVPVLVAMTKVTATVSASGVERGFISEPAPGRHHKSQRIADSVMAELDPEFRGKVKIRYFP